MRQSILTVGLATIATLAAQAQTPVFQPGQLAVLQEGDGGTNRCLPLGVISGITNYSASDLFGSRQNPIFIDEFDPNGTNQTAPSYQVAIPTNGPTAMLINGNAGTEGNLTLAGDKSRLAFTAYQGDILSITTGQPTAPSNLSYDRGIGTVDAFGNYDNPYRGGGWYGVATGKTNPRGVATDGAGHFWGCGNGYGSLYLDANSGNPPSQFQNIALTSCSKVIDGTVFASVKSSESVNLYPAGVYSFVDFFNNTVPYPSAASFLHLEIQAQAPYTTCIGFDINPPKTVAYLADTTYGIQKYVRAGLAWKLAYNLAIPGYYGLNTGIMTNSASTNVLVGCFSVTVDWSGTNPVVYATTTDSGVNSGSTYYGNRVIRINDTNTIADGTSIVLTTNMTILTTVAQPPVENGLQITNLVYKSVAFTPDLRPVITNSPLSVSAVTGNNVSFSVGASSPYPLNYQWLQNATNLVSERSATLNLAAVDLSLNNAIYQCVVANNYGAVTSSVATLTVSTSALPPSLGAIQNLTNAVGNNQMITASVSGTDPKGGFQWYLNGNPLSEGATGNGSTLAGTTNQTLAITQAAASDAGVYSLSVTNIAGSTSNAVANFYTVYSAPVMVQPPVALTTFVGRATTNDTAAYGLLVTNQWYGSLVTVYKTTTTNTLVTTNGVQLSVATKAGPSTALSSYVTNQLADGAAYAGTTTPTLAILNPQLSDTGKNVFLATLSSTTNSTSISATNGAQTIITNTTITTIISTVATNGLGYFSVVYGNPGGSITSSPAPLTVVPAPAHTFIAYANAGQVYSQNFNTLPIPGLSSAEGANPLHIANSMTNIAAMLTNGNPGVLSGLAADVSYSVDNPLDFGYPILPTGAIGGLGLSNSLGGWYAWAQKALVFAAGKGDQSQGALVDNGGNYYADGTPLTGITNRALGLLATTKTGPDAFGAALINKSTNDFSQIVLSYTGELWRNNPNQQRLIFGYVIDPAGTNSTFHPDVWDSTNGIHYVPSLDVAFPTSATTTVNDGMQPSNQLTLAASLTITNWPPGAALWLVWQAQILGSAQDVAIDNLTFAVPAPPAVTTQPASSLTPTGGTMNASVAPGGLATTCYFEYGLSTNYDDFSATNSLSAGGSPVHITNSLSGLVPNTVYHYRAIASNAQGTTVGGDVNFITPVPLSRLGAAARLSSGAFQFSFTNWPGVTYSVLVTTNLALPISQWQNLGQPSENPAGHYQFTDPAATNRPQQFYLLRQP